MEFEFDKEIDALLRKARENESVFAGTHSAPHLDADELSAFAENALPESSKKLYTAHLAECDRCRRILSNLISVNAETQSAAAVSTAAPIVETAIPWYRKLFPGFNPVYAMGALVIVFSAFIGYIVLQNAADNRSAEISQANTASAARGPNAGEDSFANTATESNMMSNTASIASNTASNAATFSTNTTSNTASTAANTAVVPAPKDSAGKTTPNTFDQTVAGGESADDGVVSATPPQDAEVLRDAKNKSEENKPNLDLAKEKPKETAGAAQPAPAAAPPPIRTEDEESDRAVTRSMPEPRANAALSAKKRAPESKQFAGKTFRREGGTWIDNEYRQGAPLTNVARGSNEYKKLDGGLKNIAEQFEGAVIVAWKSKNYRIQ